jgi:basic amino acid/polyamine antiporter, APA family
MSIIFAISAIGAMHGSIMTGSRVPFAMSREGYMPKFLSYVSPKSLSPIYAVMAEAVIAMILALSGTFDQLTDAVVFSSWIFYALCAASLFKWRKKDPAASGFKTPGYPFVPFIFVVVSAALLLNTLMTNPKPSLLGLGVILLGVPVYFFFRKKASNPSK